MSSSWPPTALQNATKHELSRARVTSISSRSRSLPRWNGDAEMFSSSCAPARARSVAGGPGCHMSSQIVTPASVLPCSSRSRSRPWREVARLVEDAVVRQEALAVDGLHLAARAHGARVEQVAVEVRVADERGDPARLEREPLQGVRRRPDEAGPQQQVLGRVAGHRELGEEDAARRPGSSPRRSARPSSRGSRRGRRRPC